MFSFSLALNAAITELRNKGRGSAHKVTVLITSAGWESVGNSPYQAVAQAKSIGVYTV